MNFFLLTQAESSVINPKTSFLDEQIHNDLHFHKGFFRYGMGELHEKISPAHQDVYQFAITSLPKTLANIPKIPTNFFSSSFSFTLGYEGHEKRL